MARDPLPSVSKVCEVAAQVLPAPPAPDPTIWVQCATENGFCGFSGTYPVRYGQGDAYFVGTFTDGVACNNSVFGDPIRYVGKVCEIAVPLPPESERNLTWQPCSAENELCKFKGTRRVRYGLNGFYVYGTFTGNVACEGTVFGSDPVPGYGKVCEVSDTPATEPGPMIWAQCATQGGFCGFNDTQQVRYGLGDTFFVGTFTDGVACNSSVFGNPLPGVGKICEVTAPQPPESDRDRSWQPCSAEDEVCTFSGTRRIRYGRNGFYAYGTFTDSVACTNEVFGDPLPYVGKVCEVDSP